MIPTPESFTEAEGRIIEPLTTPYKVQRFLNRLPYNSEKGGETLSSFRTLIRRGSAHCLEAALAAAVILEQHGHPPLLLDLESTDDLDHVVFLFRSDQGFGTVARSRDPGLHGRRPVFKTLHSLVDSYADPYVDFTGRIIGFGVFDLNDLGGYNWRLSPRNVWRVQNALIGMPHRPFHMAQKRYRFWHERYVAYKARYPGRKPLYYTGRRTWMSRS